MPADQPLLSFFFQALGIWYSLALPAAGLMGFLATLYLVFRGKGGVASGAVVLAALLPFFVGLFGTFDGAIASYRVIAASISAPHPSDVAEGASIALVTSYVGLLFSFPSILLAIIGSMIRSSSDEHSSKPF